MNRPPTFVTRLTPAGRAAIASILVRGPDALNCVKAHFKPLGSAEGCNLPLNRVIYGTWFSTVDSREGIVVCKTSDDSIELNCHGGQAAVDSILSCLQAAGCQSTEWSQLVGTNLIERECVEALAAARTSTVAAILLEQHRGALCRAVRDIGRSINHRDAVKARQQLTDLCEYRSLGLHLTLPWQVVLAGAPNVGKSSLINSLVGFERAIVYDQPGTTRDVVTAQTVLDGWLIEFADTAGIRRTNEPVEAEGVQRAVDRLHKSDLVVHVLDATALHATVDRLDDLPNLLTVINKFDRYEASLSDLPSEAILTSALTGQGVEQLLGEIGRRLVPQAPPVGAPVPFTMRQYVELDGVSAAVDAGDFDEASRRLDRLVGLRPAP